MSQQSDSHEDSLGLISKNFDVLYADPNLYSVNSCNFILWMIANLFNIELSGQSTVENYLYSYEFTSPNEEAIDMAKSMFNTIRTTFEMRLYELNQEMDGNITEEIIRNGYMASFAAGITQALLSRISLLTGKTLEDSMKVMNAYFVDYNNYLISILRNNGLPFNEEMFSLGVKVGKDMDFEQISFSTEDMATDHFTINYEVPAYYISHCTNFILNFLAKCTDTIIDIKQISPEEYKYSLIGRSTSLGLLVSMINTFTADITSYIQKFKKSEEYRDSKDPKNSLGSFVAGLTRGVILRLGTTFTNIVGREIEIEQNIVNRYLEEIGIGYRSDKTLNINTYIANIGVKSANEITMDIEDGSDSNQ